MGLNVPVIFKPLYGNQSVVIESLANKRSNRRDRERVAVDEKQKVKGSEALKRMTSASRFNFVAWSPMASLDQ